MHKTIVTALRKPLRELLKAYPLIDTHSERSGFADTFLVSDSPALRVVLIATASPVNDTFTLAVQWHAAVGHGGFDFTYKPSIETLPNEQVRFLLGDVPTAAMVNFGLLVYGRPVTYHFLAHLAPDAPVSVERLYSSGDGPVRRAARVKDLLDLLRHQLQNCLVPFVQALKEHFCEGEMSTRIN